jgi:hypothetical protein
LTKPTGVACDVDRLLEALSLPITEAASTVPPSIEWTGRDALEVEVSIFV